LDREESSTESKRVCAVRARRPGNDLDQAPVVRTALVLFEEINLSVAHRGAAVTFDRRFNSELGQEAGLGHWDLFRERGNRNGRRGHCLENEKGEGDEGVKPN